MSKKSAAVGTGAIAFKPLVDILEYSRQVQMKVLFLRGRGAGMNRVSPSSSLWSMSSSVGTFPGSACKDRKFVLHNADSYTQPIREEINPILRLLESPAYPNMDSAVVGRRSCRIY